MKYIFALMAVFFVFGITSHNANAAPFTQEMAQNYYKTCLAKQDATMTPQTQDIFCQCTARQMTTMSVEELRASANQDQSGRDATNKIIINVYAPCMEFPVRDLVFQKCQKDAFQAGQKICSCLANNMAAYVGQRAAADLPAILAQNPNAFDPMNAIVTSPTYEQQEKRIALGCIQGEYNK